MPIAFSSFLCALCVLCGRVWFSTSSRRRIAIRSGEESVFCSTTLLRRGFISADFYFLL
jgi:hypothetical protein